MATTLQMLLELNKLDLELADVRRQMAERPAAVAAAEKDLAEMEARRAELTAEARSAQVTADRSAVEIKSIEEKVQKYGVQLNITKTQKEYDAIRSEIAGCEKQISDIETTALEAYEKAEGLSRQARELEGPMAATKKELEAARAALDGALAELEKQKAGLLARRAEMVKPVDAEDLRRYEQALAKHPAGALARVGDGGLCISCNIKLSPQVYNLVLIGEPVQQCRSCGRLCYYEEVPTPLADEAAPEPVSHDDSSPKATKRKRPADGIFDEFVSLLDKAVRQYGLCCDNRGFKEMEHGGQRQRTVAVYKKEGDTRRVMWLIYCKVKSLTLSDPRWDWGLTGKILDITDVASKRLSAKWAVVLLLGGPQTGYFLASDDVSKNKAAWFYEPPPEDQYKLMEGDLRLAPRFGSIQEACVLLGIGKEHPAVGATQDA